MNSPEKLALILLCFFLLVMAVGASDAATSCHCFQERNFDPLQPQASDPYLLTTTQNSLIAAAFNVPKKYIVTAKMGGADADLLWVSYYVSARTGLEVSELIALYSDLGSGSLSFVDKMSKNSDRLDPPFVLALVRPFDLPGLAKGAFHSVMISQVGFNQVLLDRIELTGADRKEQIMAIFLARVLDVDPGKIIRSVSSGQQSWGEIFSTSGLEPQMIESVWRKLLR